ncbi:MAG: hypothetical protein JW993_04130 [Sedimentisphaerales bacterium]|nr:hypothetical protein [Sedimentisphaerales bacterium]
MNRRRSLMLLAAVLVVGGTSFVTGRLLAARRQADSASTGWLQRAPAPVREAESRFQQEVQGLTETVISHKSTLAAMLVDPCSLDEEILDQVQRVIESNMHLMYAVGTRLVELRNSLPPDQSRRLMASCVDSLQGRLQRRYRWRGGAQDDGAGPGRGYGYGGGRRRSGFGPGGRQYRGGRGSGEPAEKLQLTAAQIAYAQEHDPNFSADCVRLKEEVAAAYSSLLAALQDSRANDNELLLGRDSLIEAHSRLEWRVAQYVVMIRPQLSAEQRQRLAGLSRGQYRYRGGRALADDPANSGLLGASRVFGSIGPDAI